MLCTHRFYDSVVGRFLTRDPMGYEGGVNLYGYTANNPVNEEDSEGYMGGPGHGGAIPGWHPPVTTAPHSGPGFHSGKPGRGRVPDYYACNVSLGIPLISVNGQIERDRYGNWYLGLGGGYGTPGPAFSIVEGTLNQQTTPSQNYLKNWMDGGGVNATGAFLLSGGETFSTDSNYNLVGSTEFGVGWPQAGVSAIYTRQIGSEGK